MKNRTQGAALLVTVLISMLFLAILLSITMTMTLSAMRNTSDERASRQAQAGAESGLAFASAKIQQARGLLATVEVPQGTSVSTIETLLKKYCNTNALATPPAVITTPIVACTADPVVTDAGRLDIFKTFVNSDSYAEFNVPSDKKATYWSDLFGQVSTSQATVSTNGTTTTSYSTDFHLIPTRVLQTGQNSYQVMYRSAPFRSTGALKQSDTAVASRNISVAQSNEFYITIQRPAFNAFAQFRDLTTSGTTGGQLYFGDGEVFNGPVHTNSAPGFIGTPKFYSQFTSAATTASFSSSTTNCNNVSKLTNGTCTAMFPTGVRAKFGQPRIELPPNSNNQLRATVGGDPQNSLAVTDTELRNAWGVSSMAPNTVYFSKSNGSATPNIGSSWVGGLYINGDANVTFKLTPDGRQQISIVQGSVTNLFEKQSNGTWTVKVGTASPRTITGTFNGMIYSTGNLKVNGDGNNDTPDIASDTQITLTNSGSGKDILLKDSVTYADDPTTNPTATNVLGIYSSGGSILLDGPNNKDMIINASILATASGKGFGTVNASTARYTRYNSQPKVILTGGVIESQSQTVSSNDGGYKRNYTYDDRFKTGFSPPFFPLQQRWTSEVDSSTLKFGFWKQTQ